MTEIRHVKTSEPSDASGEQQVEHRDASSSANSDKKIAWLTVGTIALGFWAAIIFFSFGLAAFQGAFSEGGDLTGFIFVGATFLILGLLPAFGAWKCFSASRRLSQNRQSKFIQEETFK